MNSCASNVQEHMSTVIGADQGWRDTSPRAIMSDTASTGGSGFQLVCLADTRTPALPEDGFPDNVVQSQTCRSDLKR